MRTQFQFAEISDQRSSESEVLKGLGFPAPQSIKGRASIADLFKPAKRCGVYVLHCANSEYYTGKTTDVVGRFAQHRLIHPDIVEISFRACAADQIADLESQAIERMESSGLKLRNIALTNLPPAQSDFDLVMPAKLQERWRKDISFNYLGHERAPNEEQRRKYRSKYNLLEKKPLFSELQEVLRQYGASCLPAARDSEMSFWAFSCLPLSYVYSRVNVYHQEVVTAYVQDDKLYFTFHLTRSILETSFGKSLNKLVKRHPPVVFEDHQYESGGSDQICLITLTAPLVLRLLADPVVLAAIREFNWRLMKKGPCNHAQSHCPQLADAVLDL
jgi:hypothetical protein